MEFIMHQYTNILNVQTPKAIIKVLWSLTVKPSQSHVMSRVKSGALALLKYQDPQTGPSPTLEQTRNYRIDVGLVGLDVLETTFQKTLIKEGIYL